MAAQAGTVVKKPKAETREITMFTDELRAAVDSGALVWTTEGIYSRRAYDALPEAKPKRAKKRAA